MKERARTGGERAPLTWTYGTLEHRRAAFETQTTHQHQNADPSGGFVRDANAWGPAGGMYLAVTVAAATTGKRPPDLAGEVERDVEAALLGLAAVEEAQLRRLEVVWSPDRDGGFLSEDQAIARYPDLTHL